MTFLSRFSAILSIVLLTSTTELTADPLTVSAKWTLVQGKSVLSAVSSDVAQSATFTRGGMMSSKVKISGMQTIEIEITNFGGEGSYAITDGSEAKARLSTGGEVFETTAQVKGSLQIDSYDAVTGIAKGSFEFEAVNGKGERVSITNGVIE
jgi:hypothetical protein